MSNGDKNDSFKPLTEEQIEGFRIVLANHHSRDHADVQDRWDALCDMALASLSLPSPCGHPSQYAYSEDAANAHIVCLLCERAARSETVAPNVGIDIKAALEGANRLGLESTKEHPMKIEISSESARALRDWIGEENNEVTLHVGPGHSGDGLYVSSADYPEEGSDFLGPVAS